jgi:hypothetical protein
LIALVVSILGGVLIDSILSASDYLLEVSENETLLVVGTLLELTNGIAVIGIAVLLFPILKKQDEGLALGYVALRIVEVVIIIAAIIGPLTLITLGREYATAGAVDASALQAVGTSFLEVRERLVGQLTGIFFCLAALLLYTLLYQSRLVPRFISIWGLVAVALVLIWNLLEMLGMHISAGMILALPMILNELVLAIWLIAKGFSPIAAVFEPTQAAIGKV